MLLTLKEDPHPVAPDDFTEQDIMAYGARRWRRVAFLAEEFWQRWRQGHFYQLTERRKWLRPSESIKVGDLVLLREKNSRRNQWPRAMVIEVKKSDDGLVRSATIETVKLDGKKKKRFQYQRPVHDLVVLLPAGAPLDDRKEDKKDC